MVIKGKRVVDHDLARARPADEELERLLLGPSGNLRAPTVKRGRTVLVGFSQDTYADVLG